MSADFEIVEVYGKKYAQFEYSKEIGKFLKHMVLFAGGVLYKHEGKLIYAVDGTYGNLKEYYSRVFQNFEWVWKRYVYEK